MDCDLLIHEATFDDELQKRAYSTQHSTVSEAVSVAKAMRAKKCLLTHFSHRYHDLHYHPKDLPDNIGFAHDFAKVSGPMYLSVIIFDFRSCDLKAFNNEM